jgi:DNA-3-methyladenine glycosylase II
MDHPAIPHLKTVDPVLGAVIDRIGKLPPGPRTDGTHLGHLIRAIVYQQLSGKAAATIHGRFEALYGGRPPTPQELLATPDEKLRAVGLSGAKTLYLKDLAARAAAGTLPVDRLHDLDDATLTEALTSVKGIGKWTAQMFLMFRLGRPNVLPDLDLGVRKAIQQVYGLREMPTPQEVQARGAPWSPYASFAAWYLWRSLELPGPDGKTRSTRAMPAPREKLAKKRAAKKSAAKRKSAQRAKPQTKRAQRRKTAKPARKNTKGRSVRASAPGRTRRPAQSKRRSAKRS